jgi:hypothetical protein
MKPHFQSPELGQSSRRSSNFLEAAISVMPVFVAWNVLCLLATKPHFPVAGAWMELQGIFEFPQSSNFCHSWICRVEFASNKASFPIATKPHFQLSELGRSSRRGSQTKEGRSDCECVVIGRHLTDCASTSQRLGVLAVSRTVPTDCHCS